MAELISREAAINAVDRAGTKEVAMRSLQELPSVEQTSLTAEQYNDLISKLITVPSAEPKKGIWKFDEFGYGFAYVYGCSECGAKTMNPRLRYCPNCGAKMEGENDENQD